MKKINNKIEKSFRVSLTPKQIEFMKKRNRTKGISFTHMISEGINMYMEDCLKIEGIIKAYSSQENNNIL
tara:strand:- start:441 stop:650 length:210 start_codon:yes stop_codon:yes gene_type:complete